MNEIEKLSIVIFTDEYKKFLIKENYLEFDEEHFFLYLGEIPNMMGHCVVIGINTQKIYIGIHIENFRLPTEEEL